jgi:hypothetical protein
MCKKCWPALDDIPDNHPLSSTYLHMIYRCYNEKRNNYKYYGARGIGVCARWRNTFKDFVSDMGPKPTSKHSLDRIDSNRGYFPRNCRWATVELQRLNRKRFSNSMRKYKGVSKYKDRWKAEVRFDGENNYLGLFKTENEAALAYNKKLIELWGDIAKNYLNVIED